ncbi:MAG: hypothetical protein ACQEW9_07715 [Bacteroidota bacterium]|uniref:Uncharacterized protein n=1 Tax=Algoriphagus faecimaris TaxID=686796 RepID=A0A1G6ST31_9BACT|nr:hypothetical protein [Algoriphagus faecimaris]SDD19386.1 hypothetical protein SAMN04488104_101848 [Algoriphagus faecimaris]
MQVEKMEKTVTETVQKLEKLKLGDSLAAELSWCWFSYKNDQNPVGLVEKSEKALELFKAVREKNSRAVSKKLVEDLEKVLVLN